MSIAGLLVAAAAIVLISVSWAAGPAPQRLDQPEGEGHKDGAGLHAESASAPASAEDARGLGAAYYRDASLQGQCAANISAGEPAAQDVAEGQGRASDDKHLSSSSSAAVFL